jgi:hypothetical protein
LLNGQCPAGPPYCESYCWLWWSPMLVDILFGTSPINQGICRAMAFGGQAESWSVCLPNGSLCGAQQTRLSDAKFQICTPELDGSWPLACMEKHLLTFHIRCCSPERSSKGFRKGSLDPWEAGPSTSSQSWSISPHLTSQTLTGKPSGKTEQGDPAPEPKEAG